MADSIFSLRASLVDLTRGAVPTFTRSTGVNLERYVDGSLVLDKVAAHNPALQAENGAFLLEPEGANLCNYNLDLSQPAWERGGQVFLRGDYAPAPDGSYTAEQVSWVSGSGSSQILRRQFTLKAGAEYVLQLILRRKGGTFAGNDFLRAVGDVAGVYQTSLTPLNNKLGVYQKLELRFRAAGKQPIKPASTHQVIEYNIAQVSTNSLLLVIPAGLTVNTNDLVGGQLVISNTRKYQIVGNSGVANGQITVNTSEATLIADGTTTLNKAAIVEPEGVSVQIEMYVESTVAVDWGGMDLKEGKFATSMINQMQAIEPRSKTFLQYRHSPFADLKTLGVYGDIERWEGDGGLFSAGNFSAEILNGKLVVKAGGTTLSLIEALPKSFRFFIQVQESNGLISVYINGYLRAKGSVTNFRASSRVSLQFNSEAVRSWLLFLVREQVTLEGQPDVGEMAQEEVLDLFSSKSLVRAQDIAAHHPAISLPSVVVPEKSPPLARIKVDSVGGSGLNTVLNVLTTGGFAPGQTLNLVRSGQLAGTIHVLNATSSTLTIAGSPGVVAGDIVEFSGAVIPGEASVRFPCDPIEPFEILSINTASRRITLSSTLSFTRAKAFVRNDNYQDIAEVIVEGVDTIGSTITVNSVEGLAAGMVIYQPLNELQVEPANYESGITEDIDGVTVAETYRNGIVIYNSNPFPVVVTPLIKVYL